MPEDELQNTNTNQKSETKPCSPQLTESTNVYYKSPDNEHEPEFFAGQFKQRKKKIRD